MRCALFVPPLSESASQCARRARVVKATQIAPPAGYATLDTYVYVELPFPDAVALQKLQMKPPVAGSLDPVYNWKCVATIERKKSFAKFCERRKVYFEIWHARFLKHLLIGKAGALACSGARSLPLSRHDVCAHRLLFNATSQKFASLTW